MVLEISFLVFFVCETDVPQSNITDSALKILMDNHNTEVINLN